MSLISIIVTAIVTIIIIRIIYVLFQTGKPISATTSRSLRTLIVLGSGGHTAEMLNLIMVLPRERFMPRYYVAALTDTMSLQKAKVLEESFFNNGVSPNSAEAIQFVKIYRSREVGQSYLTSVLTTLLAMLDALLLMLKIGPQVILCNGPGTCLPLCMAAFIFKVVGISWCTIFYAESIARVRRLSLTGLLLYKARLADQIFVQWPHLEEKYPRARYVGHLMFVRQSFEIVTESVLLF